MMPLNAGIFVMSLLEDKGLIDTNPLPECNNPCAILTACNTLTSRSYYSAKLLKILATRELLVPNPTNPRLIIAFMANTVSCC